MTIHVKKKTLSKIEERYTVGIRQEKRYVNGIREQKELLAVYETV